MKEIWTFNKLVKKLLLLKNLYSDLIGFSKLVVALTKNTFSFELYKYSE